MQRPYIICHMVTSLDGKVTGDFLENPACHTAIERYYAIHRAYKADAFACGRITMEGSFTGGYQPDLSAFAHADIARKDFVAEHAADFFAVSFDRHGKLGWKTSHIEDEDPGYGGAHIIEVLCEDTSDAYLAYLQSIGVSYLFAGKDDLNLPLALSKLKHLYGIETLLLEGGSLLNGAFQRARVIDELSLVGAPVVAEAESQPLFWNSISEAYALKEATTDPEGVLCLTYTKK